MTTGDRIPARWDRIVLKVSGEAFAGEAGYGIDGEIVGRIARDISDVRSEFDVDIAVVVGGGNIWRGMSGAGAGMDRAQADYMGMLATSINALALQDTLEQMGQPTRVQTAIHMAQIAEPYIRRRAIRHLEKRRVVLFAAGTGNPFVTTDTGSALRALEIEADLLLMAKHDVDGVYDKDPKTSPDAVRFEHINYLNAIEKRLKVMDATALSLCMEHDVPIVVFDLFQSGNLANIIKGQRIGTLVCDEEKIDKNFSTDPI